MTALIGSVNEALLGQADPELWGQFESTLAALINKQSWIPLDYDLAASVQTNNKEQVNQDTSVDNMDVFIQSQKDNSFPEMISGTPTNSS